MFPFNIPGLGQSHWMVDVLLLVGSALFLIYFAQVVWPGIKGLLTMTDKTAEERTQELLSRYATHRSGPHHYSRSLSEPQIRFLKAGQDDNTLVFLFVNKGGQARELQVIPRGAFRVSTDPANTLNPGGVLKITLTELKGTPQQSLHFDIKFKNSIAETVTRQCEYSGIDETLELR